MNSKHSEGKAERTIREVAVLLGVDPQAVGHWVDLQGWFQPGMPGDEVLLSAEQLVLVYEHFLCSRGPESRSSREAGARGDLDGFNRAELTIKPGREEETTEEILLQIDDPSGVDSSDLVEELITWFGLGDGYSVEETTHRTEWGASGAGYSAILEIASNLWPVVASGIAPYATEKLVKKLKHNRAYEHQVTCEEAFDSARYRIVVKENIDVADIHLRESTCTTEHGLTTFEFIFDLPDDTQYQAAVSHSGNLTLSRIQKYQ